MGGKVDEVSAFEAKTRLSELLRETERGRSFVIRRRGKAVAQLIPPVKEEQVLDLKRLLAPFREIRKRIPGKVQGAKFKVQGAKFKVQSARFEVLGAKFNVQSSRGAGNGWHTKVRRYRSMEGG